MDERVRIHFMKYDHDNRSIANQDIVSDCYFRDKLFKIVPEQKFVFFEELRDIEKMQHKLELAGSKSEKMLK